MNLRVWVRHLDNFASLASAGLSLPTLRSHRHSPGASSCRQTRIIALSTIVSQYPVDPLYTCASPLLRVTQHLEKESIHSATPTKSHTKHKDSITPSLQQRVSLHTRRHITKCRWGLRIPKPTQVTFSLTILLFHNDPQALFCTAEGRLD